MRPKSRAESQKAQAKTNERTLDLGLRTSDFPLTNVCYSASGIRYTLILVPASRTASLPPTTAKDSGLTESGRP